MIRVLMPLADGVEEMEAVIPADVFRRADWKVVLAGLKPGPVTASRKVVITPDSVLDAVAGRAELKGDGGKALEHLERKLGISMGQTTPDGMFTLQQCECLGACADAPVMLVNDRNMCSFMGDDKLDQLVDSLRTVEGQA